MHMQRNQEILEALSVFSSLQKQRRIDNDKNGTGVMYQSSHNRMQYSGDGKNDCGSVQCHGKCQVAFDSQRHTPGKLQQMGNLPDLIVDQHNVSGIHGNIASHAGSTGNEEPQKMPASSAAPEITRKAISFFMPPHY